MKTQAELTVDDLFEPATGVHRDAYNRQQAFIFQVYSIGMQCPYCNRLHTANEVIYNHPDFKRGHDPRPPMQCPVTGESLIHHQDLFGGQWLDKDQSLTVQGPKRNLPEERIVDGKRQ